MKMAETAQVNINNRNTCDDKIHILQLMYLAMGHARTSVLSLVEKNSATVQLGLNCSCPRQQIVLVCLIAVVIQTNYCNAFVVRYQRM